jgi:aryl-alcohol dehydrogenase-like predicted oxidoreductase
MASQPSQLGKTLRAIVLSTPFVQAMAFPACCPDVAVDDGGSLADALDEVAAEVGKTVPQVALNWVLHRPSVATVILGARDEKQLRDNLGAAGFKLSAAQVAKLAPAG